jgi:hypothetical protein
MSGYLYFTQDHRPKLKAAFPEKGFTEIAKLLGDQWNKLAAAVREQYQQRATVDKARYQKEKETSSFRPPSATDIASAAITAGTIAGGDTATVASDGTTTPTSTPTVTSINNNNDPTSTPTLSTNDGDATTATNSAASTSASSSSTRSSSSTTTTSSSSSSSITTTRKNRISSAPKRAQSAYLFYVVHNRASMNASYPDKDFTEIAKIVGAQWRNLPQKDRRVIMPLLFTMLFTLTRSFLDGGGIVEI